MLPTYYKTDNEFFGIHQKLKLYRCPFCKQFGCLILHGYIKGNSDTDMSIIKRGHRIYCSNRRKRGTNGCGRTIAVMLSFLIKSFTLSADTLWLFLLNIKNGLMNLQQAFRHCSFGDSSAYRIYKRFIHNQPRIRTLLTRIKKPPDLKTVHDPVVSTIIHLESAFKKDPVTQFQYHFQTSFF